MGKNRITLTNGTAPDALAVARSTLEHMGYLWKQHSTTSAEAHEGGKEITRKRSRKVLLSLEAQEGELVVQRRTNGAEGFAAGLGPLTAMQVTRHYKKAKRAVEQGLERAGFF